MIRADKYSIWTSESHYNPSPSNSNEGTELWNNLGYPVNVPTHPRQETDRLAREDIQRM